MENTSCEASPKVENKVDPVFHNDLHNVTKHYGKTKTLKLTSCSTLLEGSDSSIK
jgi:hypothetical protein